MSNFLATAASRETSVTVMNAIYSVAGSNDERAVRIWAAPTEPEAIAIWEIVTNNGMVDASDYCWGAAGSTWAAALNLDA